MLKHLTASGTTNANVDKLLKVHRIIVELANELEEPDDDIIFANALKNTLDY